MNQAEHTEETTYEVIYYDDELITPTWKKAIFSVDKIVDDETYRAIGGISAAQPIIRLTTKNILEAKRKLSELKTEGYKAKIQQVAK
jgi:hypothetical protein